MDGISSATAVISLLEVIGRVTVAVYRYTASVKDAEACRRRLLAELHATTGVMYSVKTLLEVSQDAPSVGERVENLAYLISPEGPLVHLEDSLCIFLHELTKDIDDKGKLGISKKLAWPYKEKKINGVIISLERYKTLLSLALSADICDQLQELKSIALDLSQKFTQIANDHADQHKVIIDIADKQQTIADDTAEILAGQKKAQAKSEVSEDEKKRRKLLAWLNAVDCINKHEFTAKQRQKSTCTWIFDEEIFKSWRSCQQGLIWLHGKPGAGKTVIASAVINELKKKIGPGETIAYFYCDFRDRRTMDGPVILRSLLTQLLRSAANDWMRSFQDLADREEQGSPPPEDLDILRELLVRASSLHDRPILVIDALDECKDIPPLLDQLTQLHKDGRLALFLTSRTEHIISVAFTGLPSIPLNDMTMAIEDDMCMHIEKELSIRPRLAILRADLKEEIMLALRKKADGMFRWVQCQLDAISACRSSGKVRDVLRSLPNTLHETYERIIKAINPEDRSIAQRALMWLVTSLAPLTLPQLVEALKIEYGKLTLNDDLSVMHDADLLEICGSLVNFDEKTGLVALSHYSVQEYLTSGVCCVENYHVSPPAAHSQLASASVTYLLRDDLDLKMADYVRLNGPTHLWMNEQRDFFRIQSPMLLYIIDSGFKHISHILREDDPIFQLLMDLQCQMCDRPLKYELIIGGIAKGWGGNPDSMFVEMRDFVFDILIHFGPTWMMEGYLDEKPHLLKGEIGVHALILAITARKVSCAKVFLDLGVDVNKPICTNQHGILIPLTFSILESLPDFVNLFLDRGSLLPSNIIHIAVGHPKEGMPTIVRTLLQHGADVKSLSNTGNNPLHTLLDNNSWSLSENHCLETTQILIGAGCEFDAPNLEGVTPLQLAARLQFISIIQYFVGKGAHFHPNAISAMTSRYELDFGGRNFGGSINPATISMMLQYGADANYLSSTGNNPLHTLLEKWSWAHEEESSEKTVLEITKILVDAGCDFDTENMKQITPLYLAIEQRLLSVFQYLLDQGARFRADVIHTALSPITIPSHRYSDSEDFHKRGPAVIRTMLLHGADANSLSSTGNNPLHTLLGPEHDPYSFRSGYRDYSCLEITRILVDAGCEFNVTNAHDLTPLYLAISNQFPGSVIQYLLSIGAHIHNDAIHTYLQSSETKVNPAVIRIMLLHGANPNSLSAVSENNPLHELLMSYGTSCENEFLESTQILVDAGCKFDAPNADKVRPLQLAARKQLPSVIQYFICKGARFCSDDLLDTSIVVNPTTIRLMVLHGADAKSWSRTGNNPLHVLLRGRRRRTESEPDADAYLEAIKILVDAGSAFDAPNMEGMTPLHLAANLQFPSIIQYFVDKGARFQSNAIHATIRRSDLHRINSTVVHMMLLHGADVNSLSSIGDNPLHILLKQSCDRPRHEHAYELEELELEETFLQATRTLVEAGCDFDAPNMEQITPLYLAVEWRFLSVVYYLLDKGARFRTDAIHTALRPLKITCIGRHQFHKQGPGVIRTMLLYGANANSLSNGGNNPLHTLLNCNHQDIEYSEDFCLRVIRILVDAGCEFDATNADDLTPLHFAARHQFLSIMQYLIHKGARFRSNVIHDTLKHRSPSTVNLAVIRMMLLYGADANSLLSTGDCLLHTLLNEIDLCEELELVEVLVDEGCEFDTPNTEGITPFHLAARKNRHSVLQYLLGKGGRVHADVIHAVLQYSHWHAGGNPTLIRILLLRGADARSLSSTGDNLLHALLKSAWRAGSSLLEVAQMLVDAGCEFDTPSTEGITPIHLAARCMSHSVIQYLLKKGARFRQDAVLTTLRHKSFIEIDSDSSHSTVIRTMLLHGADANSLSSTGNSSLHILLEQKTDTWGQLEEEQYLQVTRTLVDEGCDFDAPNAEQITPLYLATKRRLLSVIQYLLDQGARFRADAIHTAVGYPCYDISKDFHKRGPAIIRAMLRHGADVNSLSSTGNNPLHALLDCRSHGYQSWLQVGQSSDYEDSCLQVTQILVDAGCRFDATNADDLTPLHLAARNQFLSIVRYLIRKGACFRHDALHYSLQYRKGCLNVAVIHMMLAHGADANSMSSTGSVPLHTLLDEYERDDEYKRDDEYERDDSTTLEIVEMLIDAGCEFDTPNTEGITPLHLAIRQGLFCVVCYLLGKGARVHTNVIHTALQDSKRVNPIVIRTLLMRGADARSLSSTGDNLLHVLLKCGNPYYPYYGDPYYDDACLDVAQMLVDACLDVVQMLVDAGCEFDAPNAEGITPLHLAARCMSPSVIQYLLKKGARFRGDSILTTLKHCKTPMPVFTSTDVNLMIVIRMMLLHGADVHSVSKTGNNPLHILLKAAGEMGGYGNQLLEVIEILVDAGCNVNACNWKGATPLQLAIVLKDTSIINYFRCKGAKITSATIRYLHRDHLEWAVGLPWYSDAVEAMLGRSSTPNDIVQIKHMLCSQLGLPLDITRRILDIAEHWACVSIIHHNISPSPCVSVCMPPIPFKAQLELSRIVFAVRFAEDSGLESYHRQIVLSTPVQIQGVLYNPEVSFKSSVRLTDARTIFQLVSVDVWDVRDAIVREVFRRLQSGETLTLLLQAQDSTFPSDEDKVLLDFFQIDFYFTVSNVQQRITQIT